MGNVTGMKANSKMLTATNPVHFQLMIRFFTSQCTKTTKKVHRNIARSNIAIVNKSVVMYCTISSLFHALPYDA